MKSLLIKFSFILIFIASVSFKTKDTTGSITLEVSYVSSTGGGSATITNTDTNVIYNISAVDTMGHLDVPYGNYVLNSAATNACNAPLLSSVTTSNGSNEFVIDSNNQTFTIYASCY